MIKNVITSADNQTVKYTAALLQKKYRVECGAFIAEGANIISNIPDAVEIAYYAVVAEKIAMYGKLFREGVDVYPVTEKLFGKFSDTVSPQGIIAVVKREETPPAYSDFCLILDGISDAGNMGAIMRTAAAAGYGDIYCIDCTDSFAPKAVRSSMGGIFFTNIINVGYGIADSLKQCGYTILAADMSGDNIFTFSPPSGKLALIIGNEAHGINHALKAAADKVISIPINNVESLNAGVAAGIIMYNLKITNKQHNNKELQRCQDTANGRI